MADIGRPTDYDPVYCEMLIKHMEDGLSFDSFAGVANTCFKTLYNWRRANPEFLHAYKVGRAKSLLFWERRAAEGNECIKDGDGMTITRSYPPALTIYNLKVRFKKWRNDGHNQKEIAKPQDEKLTELFNQFLSLMSAKEGKNG